MNHDIASHMSRQQISLKRVKWRSNSVICHINSMHQPNSKDNNIKCDE